MAVDTREKRNSAFAFLVPAYPPGVVPSTMDQAARQAAVWVYAGILAEPVGGAVGHPAIRRLARAGFRRPAFHDGRDGVYIFDQPSAEGVPLYKLLDLLGEGVLRRAYGQPRRAAKRRLFLAAQFCARRGAVDVRPGAAPECGV